MKNTKMEVTTTTLDKGRGTTNTVESTTSLLEKNS